MLNFSVRFRWVACQLDSLGDCFDLLHLRQALKSLPKTLDDTYARILCNIDNHYKHYNRQILKILQWLTFSLRPLQLKEVAEIIAIDVDEIPRFDPQRRLAEPRDILTMCSSLITLTRNFYGPLGGEEESGAVPIGGSQDPDSHGVVEASVSEDAETYVRLAHFSVKEYLVSDRIQHGTAPYYSIREIESHGVLAQDCIAYLLQFDEPGSLTPDIRKLSPLAQYAASYWDKHAKQAERGPIETTTLMSMELLMSAGEGLWNWIRINENDLNKQPRDLGTPLYYASEAGLFGPVKMLIEAGMDVNAQCTLLFCNALQAASHSGELKIVQILIDNGADVNTQGGDYGNALQAASHSGQEDVIQLLLNNGADVNTQGGRYGNALQAASYTGQKDIIKLLLENGADINTQDERYGSALQAALYTG